MQLNFSARFWFKTEKYFGRSVVSWDLEFSFLLFPMQLQYNLARFFISKKVRFQINLSNFDIDRNNIGRFDVTAKMWL